VLVSLGLPSSGAGDGSECGIRGKDTLGMIGFCLRTYMDW